MRPPPAVPAGATATALGESRVEIRWQPSPDPSDGIVHEVRRDGRRVAESAEARVEEGGLSPAREYCYTVVARDARGGRSEPSQPVCATTPDLTPPAAPSIVAVATSDRAVELVWERPDDNVGSVRYEVLRGGSAVAVVEKPSSEEKGLSPAREYCYTVRAFDAAGNASRPSSPACATTPDLTPPSQPAAARALALDGARIEVAWRASTDDVGVV
ncbi:MAG TPA: fibronectin type III domain-containing protein, partial [Anaeromyxobacteraceae bacterium]|nr:fibronectin type III domain-containing protein [Anaeromyxobacteraceae bacterium]